MKLELAASGLSEEEILEKAKLLMRAFGKEEAGSTAEFMLMSKQTNAALVKSGLPPKDFTLVSIICRTKVLVIWEDYFVSIFSGSNISVDKVVCKVAWLE